MTTEPLPFTRPRTRSRERLGPSPADSLIHPPIAPAASDLGRRVTRLLLLRTLVISVVLGLSIWILATAQEVPAAAVWLQSGIIAITYLTSIVFGVLLRSGTPAREVARPMHAADVIVTSLLVYATGGAESPYIFLYALSIVGAGALLYRRGAFVVTLASVGALITVALLAWTRVVDLPALSQIHPWELTAVDFGRRLGINVATLVGVGALSFIFGDQLQRGVETLATTRKAAAEVLTLHEDIVRSLSSGLITIAPDGTILTANAAAADILGQPPVLAGQPIDKLMPGLTALVAGDGEIKRADLKLDEQIVGVTVSLLRDVRNQVIGRVVNFSDLTELRRLEIQSRRSERLATVGQLAAGVAHEIRNPLASISGSIELLKLAPVASEDDRALMTIVHREVQRLNVLIGDLLDYANPRPPQQVDFDLGVMVEETLQVARGEQAFATVQMALTVDRPLPIHADPAKLRQVLWNLLRNAADAAALGGKHVHVEARRDYDKTTLVVSDDGPGIAADKLARVFDPFFTTKSKGTGLGLATCHAIVAEHHGHIDVESAPATGTRMIVTLPRRPP